MEQLRGSGKAVGVMLRGLIAAFLLTVVLLLLLAFILLQWEPDVGKTEIGIMITYVLSCLGGGWLCGRRVQQRKFLWGMGIGVFYFLILLAISGMNGALFQNGVGQGMIAFLLCAGGGMVGGMLA